MKNIFYPEKDVNKFLQIALCALIFLFSFNSFSQQTVAKKTVLDTLVTMRFDNRSLKECLSKLTDTYGVNFSYINDEIPLQHQIHCTFVDQPLKILLDTICKQANISYFFVGTQIVLKKNEQNIIPVLKDTSFIVPLDTVDTNVPVDSVYQYAGITTDDTYQMNKKYKKYFFSVFGKRRVPDSMIVVSSNDTIEGTPRTKKYRYVTCVPPVFSVGAFGGIGVAYRKLSGDDRFVTDRNSEEHNILNYTFGIQLTHYRRGYRFSYRSGLQYMTFGEDGTYNEILLIPPPQSQPGAPLIEKVIQHSYQNRYNYLMLPVMVGYNFRIERFWLSIYSGVSFAFLVSTKSTFEQTGNNGNPQQNPNGYNRNPFLHSYNSVSLVLPIQAQIAYRLNTRIQLFAAPTFNYFLTSIYSKNDASSMRPYAFNFSVGVNYFF